MMKAVGRRKAVQNILRNRSQRANTQNQRNPQVLNQNKKKKKKGADRPSSHTLELKIREAINEKHYQEVGNIIYKYFLNNKDFRILLEKYNKELVCPETDSIPYSQAVFEELSRHIGFTLSTLFEKVIEYLNKSKREFISEEFLYCMWLLCKTDVP